VFLTAVVLAGTAWFWQAGYVEMFSAKVAEAPTPMPTTPVPVPLPTPSVALPALAPAETAASPEATVVEAPALTPTPIPEPIEPVAIPAPRATPATMELRMDSTLSLRRLLETELAPVSTKAKKLDAEKPVAQKPAVEKPAYKAGMVASSTLAPASAPMPQPDAAQAAQRQQQAGKDAIAHAQGLWNAGSRDAAIDLMQEVLAATERAATAAPTPANVQLLGQMVRELTRMQLMESRPAPVLELLTRLEPVLGNQADLWAVRANAAQRLGRHQDSVHAYMTALQSRPNEQRWLLGAAVSLAALGQTASAADMATKARAVGVVSKDVLAYLRQMGVLVKD
jgi:MSHA biogenesis protein MshN